MASRNKRRPAPRASTTPSALRDPVDSLIAKRRYNEAVKQAKLCYKQEPTAEHHRLLEQATYLRAEQLREMGMTNAAKEVVQCLLELGVTDPELFEKAASLFLAVGLSSEALALQARIEAPEARARLICRAADQAVLHPDPTVEMTIELRTGTALIRSAMAALEAGDEATALTSLRDVGRGSPFADWKLFVRGLAAFRRHQSDEAHANWDRLDPARAAARVARAIRAIERRVPVATTRAEAAALPLSSERLRELERWAFGDTILGPLHDLGGLIAQERWREAVQVIGPLRTALGKIDPRLAERLTQVLYDPLIRAASRFDYHEAHVLIRSFTKAAQPLPIDPRWNRLWAIIWEGPQGDIDEAEPYWRDYLDDLRTAPAISDAQRPLARALVCTHLGEQLFEEIDDEPVPAFGPRPRGRRARSQAVLDPDTLADRRRAVEFLDEAIQLCPTHRPAYQALIKAHEKWGESDRAAEVSRRLLRIDPDDFEAVSHLADYYSAKDEPGVALEYLARARALKPLDETLAAREWAYHVAQARIHALHGRFAEGRAEFEAAGRIPNDGIPASLYTARQVVFELKAGQPTAAEAIIATVLESKANLAGFWLAARVEAARYKLPRADQARLEERWVGTISGKPNGSIAAQIAAQIGSYLENEVEYPGRDGHVRQVLDYLRRTTRIHYEREDLAKVCTVLALISATASTQKITDEAVDLGVKLAKRGRRLHPEAYEFPFIAGTLQVAKGPYSGGLGEARSNFHAALKLAEAAQATDPRAVEFVPKIRQCLTFFSELFDSPFGLPLPGGRRVADLGAMIEEFAEEFGMIDDLDDDGEDEETGDSFFQTFTAPLPFLPAPLPPPRKPSKKSKKRKR